MTARVMTATLRFITLVDKFNNTCNDDDNNNENFAEKSFGLFSRVENNPKICLTTV